MFYRFNNNAVNYIRSAVTEGIAQASLHKIMIRLIKLSLLYYITGGLIKNPVNNKKMLGKLLVRKKY